MGYYDASGEVFAGLLSSLSLNLFPNLLAIAGYVLMALGLYTIANRRGIPNPWLAWIPVANVWILGSISDQYQQVAKNKKTSRRKLLLWLYIAFIVLLIIAVVLCIVAIFQLALTDPGFYSDFGYGFTGYASSQADAIGSAMISLIIAVLLFIPAIILAIVYSVFMFMAYYDLYASCDPKNATLYLVLSIFIGVVGSVFVFICRDKDFGMHPAVPQGQTAGYQPPQQPYGYQPPVQTYQPPVQPYQPPAPPAQPPAYQPPVQFAQPPEQTYQPPVQNPPEDSTQSDI